VASDHCIEVSPKMEVPYQSVPATDPYSLSPMSLVIAVKHDDKIVIASDTMGFTTGAGDANVPYLTRKLYQVQNTDMIVGGAGSGVLESLVRTIEAAGKHFQNHIYNGGLPYSTELHELAKGQGFWDSAKRQYIPMMTTYVVIAGFDSQGRPGILRTTLPQQQRGALDNATGIVLGAQWEVAHWIIETLRPCCVTLDHVKRLVHFTIWQIGKHELKVGSPENGYPIDICTLEFGKSPVFESYGITALTRLRDWRKNLQECFMQVIKDEKGEGV
jgi:hypothetical protein